MILPLSALIPRLQALLARGFVADTDGLLTELKYLAHPVEGLEDEGWVLSQRLLAIRLRLANDNELVCALLAQMPEVRAAWTTIAAARCKEAGQMDDPTPLISLITNLDHAAAWAESQLDNTNHSTSSYVVLERQLLGVSLEQAAATPALIRILAAAALLSQFHDELPVIPLVDASGANAQLNWVSGRLLELPCMDEQHSSTTTTMLLHGQYANTSMKTQSSMNWVLAHPWPLLLAMLTFAQDTWKAENRGGLLLECPPGQNAFAPGKIAITVIGNEGDEIRCGSLADLLLKTLASLGVACFPYQPSAEELNTRLAPVVGQLLNSQIWRYQEGASGQSGQYLIHPLFADESYRLPGSKVFNRTGKQLWQTVRMSAEALYQENKFAYQRNLDREPEITTNDPV